MRIAGDQWASAFAALPLGRRLWLRGLGRSMWPLLRSGDRLLVERCAEEALRLGDVAVGLGATGLTAHVVISQVPLVTSSLSGVKDRSAMKVLGKAVELERGRTTLRTNFLLRAALFAVGEVTSKLRRVPGAGPAMRFAGRTLQGRLTAGMRRTLVGASTLRRLGRADTDALLAFISDRRPELVGELDAQLRHGWDASDLAMGAFTRGRLRAVAWLRPDAQGIWRLNALETEPVIRGLGVEAMLLDEASSLLRDEGATQMVATPPSNDTELRQILSLAGFVFRNGELRKRLR